MTVGVPIGDLTDLQPCHIHWIDTETGTVLDFDARERSYETVYMPGERCALCPPEDAPCATVTIGAVTYEGSKWK